MNEKCMICLEKTDTLKCLNGCSFKSCEECIKHWYSTNQVQSCPGCRRPNTYNVDVPRQVVGESWYIIFSQLMDMRQQHQHRIQHDQDFLTHLFNPQIPDEPSSTNPLEEMIIQFVRESQNIREISRELRNIPRPVDNRERIFNPNTNRMVLRNGRVGQQIIRNYIYNNI